MTTQSDPSGPHIPLDTQAGIGRKPMYGIYHPPNSQDSNVTASTLNSAVPQLLPSSSNISQSSLGDKAYTPVSSQPSSSQQSFQFPERSQPGSAHRPMTPYLQDNKQLAPRSVTSTPSSGVSGSPTHGAKRTANGIVKGVAHGNNSPNNTGHGRNTSLDSTGGKVGEVRLHSIVLSLALTYQSLLHS
jgi:hypothetical protein